MTIDVSTLTNNNSGNTKLINNHVRERGFCICYWSMNKNNFKSLVILINKVEMKGSNNAVRTLKLNGHVGFDTLPDQIVAKSTAEGFSFNILCIGESINFIYLFTNFT